MAKKNLVEKNRNKIIRFIKENPTTTYREITKKIKLHPERFFKGLSEAFREAGINSPRTFERKTKEENRKLIIEYIRKHPGVGGHTIAKVIKRNPSNFFKNMREAYNEAGLDYSKYRLPQYDPKSKLWKLKKKKRKEIIKLIKKDPLITMKEIESKLNIKLINYFSSFAEIYKIAGLKKLTQKERSRRRNQKSIIEFIKQNPLATQREINLGCKTHVQRVFKKGIFGAYEKAEIQYPFERLILYGTALKEIKQRARDFEEEIAVKLSGYGKVNRLVKTKRGVADIILERKNKKIIIEIKDYQKKEISISQIKQLNRYMEDLESNLGILICHNKPKKDKFIIGKNKIFVLEKQELNRIPKIIRGISYNV